ncbi:MAG: dipeptidase, partial [Candidatus Thorarchaeota archaeon]
ITICNSALGEAIAKKVLNERDRILPPLREAMLENYKIVRDWMEDQTWLEWIEPESGVVCAPRLRNGDGTDRLCELLVTKYRTFTVPGSRMELDGHFRLGFGGEQDELIKGLEQLRKALSELCG